jgi:hypothetical protein
MTSLTTKTLRSDWETVLSVQPVSDTLWTEELPSEFKTDTVYYQTHTKPEMGYFYKDQGGPEDYVYRATRGLYQMWRVERLSNDLYLEVEEATEDHPARCRRVEEYSLHETRTIVDEHLLDGNAAEIVKCLRDGLSPKADENYKDLCLGIILHHFAELDRHLDLLRPGSSYKEVLESLAKKHADKAEGESSSEESDTE